MENKCIICGKEGYQHQIIDSKVFRNYDKNKFDVNNIVMLCDTHKFEAEKTILSCEELREKGNKTPIYPIHLSFNEFVKDYDRYGNPILKNGKRLKGEFFKLNILKEVKHLFEKDYEMIIDKYPRTYHFDFSPGTTSDDRISKNINNILNIESVSTEKLDGSNTSISYSGVYGRSRAAISRNPWDNFLKPKWEMIKNDLNDFDIEIMGENMYGVHSIKYSGLDSHFYVFGVRNRKHNMFLSWDEVEYFAEMFDFELVPVINKGIIKNYDDVKSMIKKTMKEPSNLEDNRFFDSEKEGVVIRVFKEFHSDLFYNSVFKYVRKNHVKTTEHWVRNWKRANLRHELEKIHNA